MKKEDDDLFKKLYPIHGDNIPNDLFSLQYLDINSFKISEI